MGEVCDRATALAALAAAPIARALGVDRLKRYDAALKAPGGNEMIWSACAIAMALAMATSAEATTFGPLSQRNDVIAKIAAPCGAGHAGRAGRVHDARQIRRCVRHRHSGACIRYV